MHTQTTLFRLIAALAIGGLLGVSARTGTAWAQAEANAPAGDPPSRVGRLAQANGTVSFHTADETDWSAATLNYPVTSGNSFWTQPNSTADIEIGATRIALNQSTEFDIATIDDQTLSASEPQGIVYLGSTAMGQGESYQIQTPRGTVTINQPGRYAINAGDTDDPTTVTVEAGSAQVEGPGVSVTVAAQQTAVITGTDTFQANVGPGQPDPQMDALLAPAVQAPVATAAPAPAAAAPPPPVVAQMTGGADLSTVGTWAPTPQYGTVWYPPVQSGWVPYREGHWGYVAPWGWTWIDNAPWGFAPFHYGRWVQVGPRWGWVPVTPGVTVAVGVPPVYAPALVAFAGFAAGVAVGVAVGGGPSVGWVPLGPREPYYPPYHVSQNYVRNVNVTNVTNVTTITNNNTTINNYTNARAATVVPASAMTSSRPIATVARPVTPQQLAAARPVAEVPVRPTANTVGVTPAVARQLNIPRPAATPARPAAPGPAVQARPPAPAAARPGAATPVAAKPPLPALRPHTAATPAKAPATEQAPRPATPPTATARPPAAGTAGTGRPPGAAAKPPVPTTAGQARPPAPTTQRPAPAPRPANPAPQTQRAPAKPATPAPQTMRAPAPRPPAAAQRAPAPAPAKPAAKQCPPGKTTC